MGVLVAFGDDAELRAQRRRLPPAFTPPPLPFPTPQRIVDRHPQHASRAASASRATSRSPRTPCSSARASSCSSGFERLQRRGPPRLRRAVPVLAVLLRRRRSRRRSRCKVFGVGLFSVRLRPARSKGPTPWHAQGHRLHLAALLRHRRRLRHHLGRGAATRRCRRSRSCRCSRGELDKRENWRALPPGRRQPAGLAARARRRRPTRSCCIRSARCGSASARCRSTSRIDKVGNQKPDRRQARSRSSVSSSGGLAKRGDAARAVRARRSSRTSTTPTSSRSRPSSPATAASTLSVAGDAADAPARWCKRVVRYELITIDSNCRRFRAASSASPHLLFDALPRAAPRSRSRRCRKRRRTSSQPFARHDRGRRRDAYAVASPGRQHRAVGRRLPQRGEARDHLDAPARRRSRARPATLHVIPAFEARRMTGRSPPTRSCPGCGRASPTRSRRRPGRQRRRARVASTSSSTLAGEPVDGGSAAEPRRPRRRAVRAGRRRRHRPARDRPHRAARLDHQLRAELPRRRSSSTTRTSRGATRRRRPTATGLRLRPWIALVVLEDEVEFAEGTNVAGGRCRSSTSPISATLPAAPTSSGRGRTCTSTAPWPPATPSSSSTDMGAVLPRLQATLAREPRPRLLAPRVPAPARSRTPAYHAFLVPTFESGRLAGLGLDPAGAPFATALGVGDVRGRPEPSSLPVLLPLVLPHRRRRATSSTWCGCCKPQPVDPRVGTRDIDVQRPGAEPARASTDPTLGGVLQLGGALRVPRTSFTDAERARRASTATRTGTQPYPHPFQEQAGRASSTSPDDYAAETAAGGQRCHRARDRGRRAAPTR